MSASPLTSVPSNGKRVWHCEGSGQGDIVALSPSRHSLSSQIVVGQATPEDDLCNLGSSRFRRLEVDVGIAELPRRPPLPSLRTHTCVDWKSEIAADSISLFLDLFVSDSGVKHLVQEGHFVVFLPALSSFHSTSL